MHACCWIHPAHSAHRAPLCWQASACCPSAAGEVTRKARVQVFRAAPGGGAPPGQPHVGCGQAGSQPAGRRPVPGVHQADPAQVWALHSWPPRTDSAACGSGHGMWPLLGMPPGCSTGCAQAPTGSLLQHMLQAIVSWLAQNRPIWWSPVSQQACPCKQAQLQQSYSHWGRPTRQG